MKKLLFTAIFIFAFGSINQNVHAKNNNNRTLPILDELFFDCLSFANAAIIHIAERTEGGLSPEGAALEFNRNFSLCYLNDAGLLTP